MDVAEDLLHYVWLFQKYDRVDLQTTQGQALHVLHPGRHNRGAGPDFAEGGLVIDGLRWAGAVECHVRSADWHAHGHSADPAYARVVLHVVWQHDAEVYLPDGTTLPVLELRGRVAPALLARYKTLVDRLIPGPACAPLLANAPALLGVAMAERALLERLEAKATAIEAAYEAAGRDWEETAYRYLAQAWGAPYNGAYFNQITTALPLRYVRRLAGQAQVVEALLLGQAGLLPTEKEEGGWQLPFQVRRKTRGVGPKRCEATRSAAPIAQLLGVAAGGAEAVYAADLPVRGAIGATESPCAAGTKTAEGWAREYTYQAGKLGLPPPLAAGLLETGRVRPAYQPALKLAQLANLLAGAPPLFDSLCRAAGLAEVSKLLQVKASAYWQKRYTIGPEGKTGSPKVSVEFMHRLVANAVVPLLIAYGRQRGQATYTQQALELLEALPPENNNLTRPFTQAGMPNQDAAQSQGLIGLNKQYCAAGRCMQCQLGVHFMSRETKAA